MRTNVWMLCLMAGLAVGATAQAQGPGGGRGGGFGRGGFGRGGVLAIMGNEAVQKDLGLSADDAAKVKTVADDFGTAMREAMSAGGGPGNFQDMTPEERTKMMEKMAEINKATTAKFLPKLKELLSADQYTRLQQINWQNMGTGALSDAEVVKGLAISKEQQDKVTQLTDEYSGKTRELFQNGGGGGGGFEKMQELNKERDAKINEVLTKDQLDKFATLKGKEFDVAQLRRGPGGGGPGGGGGAGGRPKRPQPKAE